MESLCDSQTFANTAVMADNAATAIGMPYTKAALRENLRRYLKDKHGPEGRYCWAILTRIDRSSVCGGDSFVTIWQTTG